MGYCGSKWQQISDFSESQKSDTSMEKERAVSLRGIKKDHTFFIQACEK